MVLEMPSENRQCQGRGNMAITCVPSSQLLILSFKIKKTHWEPILTQNLILIKIQTFTTTLICQLPSTVWSDRANWFVITPDQCTKKRFINKLGHIWIEIIIIIIIIIITYYLSAPFIILQIHKGASRVIFTNFLNAHPLTQPHPHAVRRKVIIISDRRLVPEGAKSLLSVVVG